MNIDSKTARQIVDTIRDVCGHDINFIRPDGKILASTDPVRVGTFHEIGRQAARQGQMLEVAEDDAFYGTQKGVNLPFFWRGECQAVIGISGDPDQVRKYAILARKVTGLIFRERELMMSSRSRQEEARAVIQALLYGQSIRKENLTDFLQKYGLTETDSCRTLIIRVDTGAEGPDTDLIGQDIRRIFENAGSRLWLFEYPDRYILIEEKKRLKENSFRFDRLLDKWGPCLDIGIGGLHRLKDQRLSEREAQIALSSLSSRLPDSGRRLVCYDELDLEILLGALPGDVKESFSGKILGGLDQKALRCLAVYFSCDCRLKEAAHALFIHENTLKDQLDRVRKMTGFDPRNFRQAQILYLAMQVKG